MANYSAKMKSRGSAKRINREARNESVKYDTLSTEETYVVENIKEIFDAAFRDVKEQSSITNVEMATRLYPAVPSYETVSKILAISGSEKKHVNLKILAALHFAYGISIDEILDKALADA